MPAKQVKVKLPHTMEELRTMIIPYLPEGCSLHLHYSSDDQVMEKGSLHQSTSYTARLYMYQAGERYKVDEQFEASAISAGKLLLKLLNDVLPRAAHPVKKLEHRPAIPANFG